MITDMNDKKVQFCFMKNNEPEDSVSFGPEISLTDAQKLFLSIVATPGVARMCYKNKINAFMSMIYVCNEYKNDGCEEYKLFVDFGKPQCMHCGNAKKLTTNMTYEQCMHTCMQNMKNGRCCDEFMCETVGETLFPEHYKILENIVNTK